VSARWPNDGFHNVAAGRAQQFRDTLNEFFVDEGIGWQMIEGEIVTRGTEAFESNVHGAVDALVVVVSLPAMNFTKRCLTYPEGRKQT
jgi:hypothetical protein